VCTKAAISASAAAITLPAGEPVVTVVDEESPPAVACESSGVVDGVTPDVVVDSVAAAGLVEPSAAPKTSGVLTNQRRTRASAGKNRCSGKLAARRAAWSPPRP